MWRLNSRHFYVRSRRLYDGHSGARARPRVANTFTGRKEKASILGVRTYIHLPGVGVQAGGPRIERLLCFRAIMQSAPLSLRQSVLNINEDAFALHVGKALCKWYKVATVQLKHRRRGGRRREPRPLSKPLLERLAHVPSSDGVKRRVVNPARPQPANRGRTEL